MYIINLPGKVSASAVSAPWAEVGEITTSNTTGTLVRNTVTGVYAQADADTIRELDQRAVALALAATVPGVDLDGETELTAAQAAELIGQTVQTIKYWRARGYITPVTGSAPARYKKADILTVASRVIKSGRPKKGS